MHQLKLLKVIHRQNNLTEKDTGKTILKGASQERADAKTTCTLFIGPSSIGLPK